MKPVKCVSRNEIEIEFEQREFFVVADTTPFCRMLYSEYRIYRPHFLRTRREMVRRKQIHDEHPPLHPLNPMVPQWIDQTVAARTGPIPRHSKPWFLSKHAMYHFAKQCRNRTWTVEDWADEDEVRGQVDPAYAAQSLIDSDSSSDD